jgi:hypothetical protein
MANPFGGSGETLSKNTGHTNQANLLYAVVPRSTSVIKEVLNDITLTLGGQPVGSYDADGYFIGSSTAMTSAEANVSGGFDLNSSFTMIAGFKNTGNSNNAELQVGIYNVSGGLGYYKAVFFGSPWENNVTVKLNDGAGHVWENGNTGVRTNAYTGVAAKSATGAQSGGYVNATTTPPTGTYTALSTTGAVTFSSLTMNRLVVQVTSTHSFQYLFIYNTTLSDAHIEAIIENPGAVLSIAPSVQLAAPTSDISAGNWLRSSDNTGTGLYTMLDESTYSDADYTYVNSDSTMEVKFASVSDPATSSGHKVRYRIKGNGVATITVSLRQGSGTEIASWTHTTASTTTTTHEQTLTSGQADSITDYADLRLRFVTFTP